MPSTQINLYKWHIIPTVDARSLPDAEMGFDCMVTVKGEITSPTAVRQTCPTPSPSLNENSSSVNFTRNQSQPQTNTMLVRFDYKRLLLKYYQRALSQ